MRSHRSENPGSFAVTGSDCSSAYGGMKICSV